MKILLLLFESMSFMILCNLEVTATMPYNQLTPEEENVIVHKGTERPYSGMYYKFTENGVYTCKRCNAPLYNSSDKFDARCGWPSFDAEIPGAVLRIPDPDGGRTEILCAACNAHLGHVFLGERFTAKNTRHCVNSISINFVPAASAKDQLAVDVKPRTEQAIYAGGCFWGVEYLFQRVPGVVATSVGYTGGSVPNPTYRQVCSTDTGHAEAIEVIFDPAVVSYEALTKLFFEIHDPTQVNRQGPDVGDQYRSEIFYTNEQQKTVAEQLMKVLRDKGLKIATKVTKATAFWKAEDYHQDYYDKKGGQPYCHIYTKRF